MHTSCSQGPGAILTHTPDKADIVVLGLEPPKTSTQRLLVYTCIEVKTMVKTFDPTKVAISWKPLTD